MTQPGLRGFAFSPLSRPTWRAGRASVALLTTHDETLRANAAKWVLTNSEKLLRQSRARTLSPPTTDERRRRAGSATTRDDDDDDAEIASPGRTAPALTRGRSRRPGGARVRRARCARRRAGPGRRAPAWGGRGATAAARAAQPRRAVARRRRARARARGAGRRSSRARRRGADARGGLVGMSEEDGFRLVAVGSGTQRLSALVGEEEADLDETETRWDIRLDSGAAPVRAALRELLADDEAPLAAPSPRSRPPTRRSGSARRSCRRQAPRRRSSTPTRRTRPAAARHRLRRAPGRAPRDGADALVRGTRSRPAPPLPRRRRRLGLADAKGTASCVAPEGGRGVQRGRLHSSAPTAPTNSASSSHLPRGDRRRPRRRRGGRAAGPCARSEHLIAAARRVAAAAEDVCLQICSKRSQAGGLSPRVDIAPHTGVRGRHLEIGELRHLFRVPLERGSKVRDAVEQVPHVRSPSQRDACAASGSWVSLAVQPVRGRCMRPPCAWRRVARRAPTLEKPEASEVNTAYEPRSAGCLTRAVLSCTKRRAPSVDGAWSRRPRAPRSRCWREPGAAVQPGEGPTLLPRQGPVYAGRVRRPTEACAGLGDPEVHAEKGQAVEVRQEGLRNEVPQDVQRREGAADGRGFVAAPTASLSPTRSRRVQVHVVRGRYEADAHGAVICQKRAGRECSSVHAARGTPQRVCRAAGRCARPRHRRRQSLLPLPPFAAAAVAAADAAAAAAAGCRRHRREPPRRREHRRRRARSRTSRTSGNSQATSCPSTAAAKRSSSSRRKSCCPTWAGPASTSPTGRSSPPAVSPSGPRSGALPRLHVARSPPTSTSAARRRGG